MDRPGASSIVRKILRSPSLNRRSKKPVPLTERVTLERVLGFTVQNNAGLTLDKKASILAYPAGCTIVLLNIKKNRQAHIFNASKKAVTTIAFSPDGKYLVTGECGHQPNVRVWDVEEKTQIHEFKGHKFGINCVAFSPNMKYIISVGSQHDMIVNVWNWRAGVKFASNKISSKVNALAFAEDGSYFVTVGMRHVKFWYLDQTKSRVKETVPLQGRSGILGDQRNNFFTDVACGKGKVMNSTFCITESGLLCEFNEKRLLDKWVELRTKSATCISSGSEYLFIGCAEGVVRIFNPSTLNYIVSLPKPHFVGIDVACGLDPSQLVSNDSNVTYPDTLALCYDDKNKRVVSVYNDHSMYVWNVKDPKKVGKINSYLYHSQCIWGLEMFPDQDDPKKQTIPSGSFLTCSSDDTIRIWNIDQNMSNDGHLKRNIFSNDLLKILYTDPEYNFICNVDYNPSGGTDKTDNNFDGKNGIRSIKVSPDGKHLASGDRAGNVRIHNLHYMNELGLIEAHDAEVLCLEYHSVKKNGDKYLATSSRDRLVHVFDVNNDYSLLQTLDDHSSSITAVRFTEVDGELQMLSCGADKSVLFRTAQKDGDKVQFSLRHHLVGKTTLYDMIIDPTNRFVATACQDRNVRVYNIKTGKQKKCYKGSTADDGTLLKCQLDPSGSYLATSSSDKNLSIVDFFTGECMSVMYGHSEVAPALKFTNDMRHLISVSGDGCIFIWKLSQEFVLQMRQRKNTIGNLNQSDILDKMKATVNRRRTFNTVSDVLPPSANRLEPQRHTGSWDSPDVVPIQEEPNYSFNVNQLPSWAKKQVADKAWSTTESVSPQIAKGCWAKNIDEDLVIKSYHDTSAARIEPVMIVDDDDQNQDDDDDDDGFYPLGRQSTGSPIISSWKAAHSKSLDEPIRRLSDRSDDKSCSDEDEEDEEDDPASDEASIYFPERERDSTSESTFNIYALSSDELRLGKKRLQDSKKSVNDDIQDPEETDTTEPLSDDEFSCEFTSPLTSTANTPIDLDISREDYVKQTFEDLGTEEFSENPEEAIAKGFLQFPRGNVHRRSISSKFLSNAQQVQLQKRLQQLNKDANSAKEEVNSNKELSPNRSHSGSPKSNMRKSWSVSDLSLTPNGSRHSSPEAEPMPVPENQLKSKKIAHRSQTLAAPSKIKAGKKAAETAPRWSTLPSKAHKAAKSAAAAKSLDQKSASAHCSPNPSPVKKRFNRTPVSSHMYVSQPNLDNPPVGDTGNVSDISARSVPDIINEIETVAAGQRSRFPSLDERGDPSDHKTRKQIPVGLSFPKHYSKSAIEKSDAPLSSAVSSRNEGFMKKATQSKLNKKPASVTRPKDLLFTSSGEHDKDEPVTEKITFTDSLSQSLPTVVHIPKTSSNTPFRAPSPIEEPVKDNCSRQEHYIAPYPFQTSTVLSSVNSCGSTLVHNNTYASVTTTNANGSVLSSVSNSTFDTSAVPAPISSPVQSVSPSVLKKNESQPRAPLNFRRMSSNQTTASSPVNGKTALTPDRSRLSLPINNNDFTSSGEYEADPIDNCTQAVTDLKRAALKATNMYEKLLRGKTSSPSDKSSLMMKMLQEAFSEVSTLLDSKDYVKSNAQTRDVTSQTLFTGPMPSIQLDDRMHVVMENMLHQYSSDLAHKFISLVEDKLDHGVLEPKKERLTLESEL